MIENNIYNLMRKLWPLNRSITGQGTLDSLKILKGICKELNIKKVPSGTKVFDWVVPNEWSVTNAYIVTPDNKRILDYKKNNLHLVSFSTKINKTINLKDLKKKLHTIKNQPNAVPYVTSYYKKNWGFCIKYNDYKKLKKGFYKVCIDSSQKKGNLVYGELILKGKSKKEIFFSCYICHPSMANNELSGPCLMVFLASWIKQNYNNFFTIRIIFIPETIGSLVYLSKNRKKLKKNMKAGFNITCVGDNRDYSYISSRQGNGNSDNIAEYVFKKLNKKFKKYNWNERGSDERNYCAPGIDLPVSTIMRSKFGSYPEYHTSEDKLGKVVTRKSLRNSFVLLKNLILAADNNCYPKTMHLGEPFMSKRHMYPTISKTHSNNSVKNIMNVISYCDGKTSAVAISEKCNISIKRTFEILKILKAKKIIKY